MPHALVSPGLQALILCGPGHSFDTFTSNPEELPKALLPIANRPMVWYPLDWCYRMGISGIHLVTPAVSQKVLEAALSQNPHLTSLPSPKPVVLAPESLTSTSGTAEILRTPEVQAAIKGDFIILPCDLVCEIPGETFLDSWMIHQANTQFGLQFKDVTIDDTRDGRTESLRGGLSIWYETAGENAVKGEETDFLVTAPLDISSRSHPSSSSRKDLVQLIFSTTSATLKDNMEENEDSIPIRQCLPQKYARTKILRTYRDSHVYIFPHWVLDLASRNETMDTLSEDLLAGWAKALWQEGFEQKLGFEHILSKGRRVGDETGALDDLDLEAMTSTGSVRQSLSQLSSSQQRSPDKESRLPTILASLQPNNSTTSSIRRVDTPALLLQVSLYLARLEPVDESTRTQAPFSHPAKIAHPNGVAPKSTTVTRNDCLLSDNVTVEERAVIKESVIGANCQIKSGARLTRCVLMDGVVVGEKCQLTGCILGRRSQVGRESILKECEVQNGNTVPDRTESKGEKFTIFEGLDDGADFTSDPDDAST